MESCDPCPVGTYQHKEGAVECDACSPGTFQPFEGQTQCEVCRAGGFCANNVDVGTCDGGFTACPIGMFNNVTGKYNASSCVQCHPGKYFACLLKDTTYTIYIYMH